MKIYIIQKTNKTLRNETVGNVFDVVDENHKTIGHISYIKNISTAIGGIELVIDIDNKLKEIK